MLPNIPKGLNIMVESLETFLRACGGRPEIKAGADPKDPDAVQWNFGVKPVTEEVNHLIRSKPTFHDRFPNLVGKWDGSSVVNHWIPCQKVLGDKAEDLIQYQPRGTCGGRSGSAAGDIIQCILIAMGLRPANQFRRTSHAAVYYAARKMYDMIGGNWRDENNDGVAAGSVPEALSKVAGYVTRDEDGDTNWYGEGSDDLACQLESGKHPEIAKKILELGADNMIQWSPVNSAAEAADGIAAGGVLIGSDSQGFTMQRDKDGFCSPRGTWQHYHIRVSVGKFNGRPGFGYFQSWSKTVPGGPRLTGHPGNCFGVDWDVQDRCIKRGQYAIITGFPVWDLEEDRINVDWMTK